MRTRDDRRPRTPGRAALRGAAGSVKAGLPPATTARGRATGAPGGFTLVEAVISVVIFGVLAAVAMPMFRSADFQKNAALRVVSSTLRSAQSRAVSGQTDVAVIFDTDAQVMRIHEDENRDGVVNSGEHTTAVSLNQRIVFGQGGAPAHPVGSGPTTFDGRRDGHPVVVFHRNGAASEAGGVYVTSARAQNQKARPADARLVTVERATGRISWYRYDGDEWTRSD